MCPALITTPATCPPTRHGFMLRRIDCEEERENFPSVLCGHLVLVSLKCPRCYDAAESTSGWQQARGAHIYVNQASCQHDAYMPALARPEEYLAKDSVGRKSRPCRQSRSKQVNRSRHELQEASTQSNISNTMQSLILRTFRADGAQARSFLKPTSKHMENTHSIAPLTQLQRSLKPASLRAARPPLAKLAPTPPPTCVQKTRSPPRPKLDR